MSINTEPIERTPGDLALFALTFFGFIVTAFSLIATCLPGVLAGVGLMGFGLLGLLAKGLLGE
jgi:hypothetical protein